jgi:hypothetical protein
MSNFKPITTRAKCDYSNLPVNQEVTVDAKGKTPVKLGYTSPLKQTKPINRRQNQPNNQNDGTIRVKDAVSAAGDIAKDLVNKVGDIKLSTPEGRKRRQQRKDLRKKQKIERKQARVDELKNSPAQKKCYK